MLLRGPQGIEPFVAACRLQPTAVVIFGSVVVVRFPFPPAGGPSLVPAAYRRPDCREGVTGGSAAADAAFVVFSWVASYLS